MASVCSKRKSLTFELKRVVEKLNLLNSRLNNLALGKIQICKVCVSFVRKLDELKRTANGNTAVF